MGFVVKDLNLSQSKIALKSSPPALLTAVSATKIPDFSTTFPFYFIGKYLRLRTSYKNKAKSVIGRLQGILSEKQPPDLLVDVQGVGYEVQASLTTFFQLPAVGETVTLFTHFVVREDAQLLYGFADTRERELFRTLIKVNGVGPKMALAILSGMNADEFVRCVQLDDVSSLVKLPGVGKKTAERLIIEMRDRLKAWGVDGGSGGTIPTAHMVPSVTEEAESALVALGYKPQDAAKMVKAVYVADDQPGCETLIRLALKSLVK